MGNTTCFVCEQEPDDAIEIPGFGSACVPGCVRALSELALSELAFDWGSRRMLEANLSSPNQFDRIAAAKAIAVQNAVIAAPLN